MPELPEAEACRALVEKGALHRTVEAVALGEDVQHVDLPPKTAQERLTGHQLTEARRHGKMVFAGSRSGPWMAVHLGMTGSLVLWEEGEGTPDYARITFVFEGARRLSWLTRRKLGWVRVIDDPDTFVAEEGYGPDALAIGREAFGRRLGRGMIKPALMDQSKLAGIGNLWSDEILFQTGTAPDAHAADLSPERIGAIHDAMRRLLRRAVEVGADYGALPADWLIHNRKEGARCPRCGGTIAKKTVGGRTAYHCPGHQRAAA